MSKSVLPTPAAAMLAACSTNPPPPLATPETFENVPCEDLVRLKYDQEVKLLKLSTKLPSNRSANNELSEAINRLIKKIELNETADEVTAVRVQIAAIDYNLSNRCRQ